MVTRREFIRTGALAGAGLMASGTLGTRSLFAAVPVIGSTIPKWQMALPIPAALAPTGMVGTMAFYDLRVTEQAQQVLPPGYPASRVWGYGGSFPGPTIEATVGTPIQVRYDNKLGNRAHLLPVDHTTHGSHSEATMLPYPDRRIVTHLHGGEVPPDADGWPEAWYTQTAGNPDFNLASLGPYAAWDTYVYPNQQQAAPLWYHDHALGITRLNVYAGLAGFYLLRDPAEALTHYGLPWGPYEIPIVLQDRRFDTLGQLFFPATIAESLIPFPAVPGAPTPTVIPEFAGDVSVVNGAVWPVLNVERTFYRFRVLNGSNSRFYHLRLREALPGGGYAAAAAPIPIWQIGTDGGFLPAPVRIDPTQPGFEGGFLIGPGERFDLVADFSGIPAGREFVLYNDADIPFSLTASGALTLVDPKKPGVAPLFEIMKFSVVATLPNSAFTGTVPGALPYTAPTYPLNVWNEERIFTENEGLDPLGRILPNLKNQLWADPLVPYNPANPVLSDYFHRGKSYRINLVNQTADYHPIHFHLRQFHVLERLRINRQGTVLARQPVPPNEAGAWKDTILVPPGWTTRILLNFPANGHTGNYPWHCHILDHEDHEMMLRYNIS